MIRFLIFGVLGIVGQVIASCIRATLTTRKLSFSGEASLALFPFWGLIAFFYPLIAIRIGSVPWYGRGVLYAAVFVVLQLLLGIGLSRFHCCPWTSSGKASLFGVVRLADIPTWFVAGLAIEWIYPWVKTAAETMGRGS